jgi:hypothetical protein
MYRSTNKKYQPRGPIKGLSVDEIIHQFRNLTFSESNLAEAAHYKDQLAAIIRFRGDRDIDELIRYLFDELRDLHEEELDSLKAGPLPMENRPVKTWLDYMEERSKERHENLSLDKAVIALRSRHFEDWYFQWLTTCIIKLYEKAIKLGTESEALYSLVIELLDNLEDFSDQCIWCGYVRPSGPDDHYKTCEKRNHLLK